MNTKAPAAPGNGQHCSLLTAMCSWASITGMHLLFSFSGFPHSKLPKRKKHTFKHEVEVKKVILKHTKKCSKNQAISSDWENVAGGSGFCGASSLYSKIKSHLAWIDSRSLKPDLQSSAAICIK